MIKEKYIPVEGHPGLYRDSATNAIINMNKNASSQNRKARERAIQRDQDIENLKSEVSDIKQLLNQILERL